MDELRLNKWSLIPLPPPGERQFTGMIDVYAKTIKSDGLTGLYRGFVISCVGIVVYRGCYFGFYDSLKPIVLGENPGLMVSFALGYSESCRHCFLRLFA